MQQLAAIFFTSDKPHYPFELPKGWEWTTLGEISNYGINTSVKVEEIDDNNWVLELEDIEKDSAKLIQKLSKNKREIKGTRHKFYKGNVLYSKLRTYLNKVLIASEDGYCTTEIMPFDTYGILSNEYICHVLRSSYFLDYTLQCGYGVKMPRLSTTDACNGVIPLPPLHEQYRIVKEIKRWFTLISMIEKEKDNLRETIKQAKAKVLDLAIHGKLVPQNPNDKPAVELLKRINPKAEIISDNGHYQKLPVGWCLTKVKDAFIINPKNKENDDIEAGFVPMANISDGFSNHFSFETKKWETIKSGFTHFSDGDIAVAKISPCLENRKSMVLSNLPNGIGAGTTELHVFRPLCVTQLYGLYFFKSNYFINKCIGTFNGVVGQQRVGKNIVECIDFPLPPLAEQQRIVAKIEEIFQQLDMIETAL